MDTTGLYLQFDEDNTVIMPSPSKSESFKLGELPCLIFQGETYDALTRVFRNFISAYPNGESSLCNEALFDMKNYIEQCFLYDDFRYASHLGRASFVRIMDHIISEGKYDDFGQESVEDEFDDIKLFRVSEVSKAEDFLMLCYNYYIIDLKNAHDAFIALATKQSGKQTPEEKDIYERFINITMDLPPMEMKLKYNDVYGRFIPVYRVTSYEAYMALEYMQMVNKNVKYRRCQNPQCNRFFLARRTTARFCNYPSPQNDNKTCRMVYPQILEQEKKTEDTIYKMIRGTQSRLYNIRKRHPEKSDMVNAYLDDIEKSKEEYSNKVLTGEWSMANFSDWLNQMGLRKRKH